MVSSVFGTASSEWQRETWIYQGEGWLSDLLNTGLLIRRS